MHSMEMEIKMSLRKKKISGAFCSLKLKLRERMVIMFIDGMFLGTI